MPVNTANLRRHLRAFEWKPLFIEVLRWSNPTERAYPLLVGNDRFTLTPVAQLAGMHVYVCIAANGMIPNSATRKAIENQVKERQYEHIIIFEDGVRQQAIFQWMKRGQGAARSREYAYTRGQSGEQLLQRLSGIAFEFADLDEEGKIDIAKVVERVQKSLDVESVTKKFYDEFTRQRDAFQKFLQGIPATADDDARWYVSVMMNRLMFIYFVQTKSFLAGDQNYLKNKLEWSKKELGAGRYFHDFLQVLFFEGFAKEEAERTAAVQKLLGKIPYLNGGLFIKHPLEEKYGEALNIADEAFDKLYDFFGKWRWHLSERPGDHQNEIDPDVLGYIFEKYINQKQMGAYYTKEDITGYICRNTIIPRLFDKADLPLEALKLPQTIRAYIYPAVTQRECLPTETEREYRARQERAARLIAEAGDGKIATINDAITANLNVEAMVYDLVPTLDAHATKRLYDALATLSVLDPTCGSGAFLFAAIKILKPIYEQVLERMAILIDRRQTAGFPFKEILDAEQAHANRDYFVTKSIVVRNLYGVDIMEEATEICKLRLFLRLVADLEDANHIEPLPDIDFNIRAGNALVGYATLEDVGGGYKSGLGAMPPRVQKLLSEIQAVQQELSVYRTSQLQINPSSEVFRRTRGEIRDKIAALNTALDGDMLKMGQIHRESDGGYNTQPFHWFTAFYEILNDGGFDVIVGNPPYVEYSKVKGDHKKNGDERYTVHDYATIKCGNIYAFVTERVFNLVREQGRFGLIVPVSLLCTERLIPLQQLLLPNVLSWNSSFDMRPSSLFSGVAQRLTIALAQKLPSSTRTFLGGYRRWQDDERPTLLSRQSYVAVPVNEVEYGYIPKISLDTEYSIWKKLRGRTIADYEVSERGQPIYVHRIVRYFVKAIDFIPYFWNEKEGLKKSEDYKPFFLDHQKRLAISAIINSSLFYWFWHAFSDGFHCGYRDVRAFGLGDFENSVYVGKLNELGSRLMDDLKSKAVRKVISSKATGRVEYDELTPRGSLAIVSEIDRVLAAHYGFTAEEVDFIINYDIKYRMGREADEAEQL